MTSCFVLSVFGDEISDKLSIQLQTLAQLQISFVELRSVWGKKVLDFDDPAVGRIGVQCQSQDIRVSAIGRPIGKSALAVPLECEIRRLHRAYEIGDALDVRLIRCVFWRKRSLGPDESDRGFWFIPITHSGHADHEVVVWRHRMNG